MRIRKLEVSHFRGIPALDWEPAGQLACLVGAGDASKSTILDAIEWVLWPRPFLDVSDADFADLRTDEPITIEATVGQVPGGLLADDKFGLYVRGWGEAGLSDEPDDDHELVLTVRLTVDDSLDPEWVVTNDRMEPRRIGWRDRAYFGVARLDPSPVRHLTWGRGSALARITADVGEADRALSAAERAARIEVGRAEIAALQAAAGRAEQAAKEVGIGSTVSDFNAAVDPGGGGSLAASLALHSGEVPMRLAGLGSRRIAGIAIQRLSVHDGAILLVDELESGLEPHRLRHLVRLLRGDTNMPESGQVIATTHSPVVVVEVAADELGVVRKSGGKVQVVAVADTLQSLVRREPEAFLGRQILVCEGKTEVGLVRGLSRVWAEDRAGVPLAHHGVVVTHGQGSAAPGTARDLKALGYEVGLLIDSDAETHPSPDELIASGVRVWEWGDGLAIEGRLAQDLPLPMLDALLECAAEAMEESREQLAQQVNEVLGGAFDASSPPSEWLTAGCAEETLRAAIAEAAGGGRWFKRIDRGEILSRCVRDAQADLEGTATGNTLRAIANWAYGD